MPELLAFVAQRLARRNVQSKVSTETSLHFDFANKLTFRCHKVSKMKLLKSNGRCTFFSSLRPLALALFIPPSVSCSSDMDSQVLSGHTTAADVVHRS